jgi:membrane peptidoglycan carboxypeptidase
VLQQESSGAALPASDLADPAEQTSLPDRSTVALKQDQPHNTRLLQLGRVYPQPELQTVTVSSTRDGRLVLLDRPQLAGRVGDRFAGITSAKNFVFYTVDPELQDFVTKLTSQARAEHVAIVAMNPRTGAILAIAGRSGLIDQVEYHADFPAASLFKVVTAAAAVEEAGIRPDSLIPFRGGTYTLNESNYRPDPARDRKIMSVAEALGRSCNPVFGQLGVRYLNGSVLQRYARRFGFNRHLQLEAPLTVSNAQIPQHDDFELSRTAAGFGQVSISPVHAATLMAGVANGGLLPRPYLVEQVVSPDGKVLDRAKPDILNRIVQPGTASALLEMMRYTTTIGTSRREFMRGTQPTLGNIEVVGKTGTLKGENPVGLNNWFIGSAPLNNPELALAVITVDAQHASKASRLARMVFEKYFNVEPAVAAAAPPSPGRVRRFLPRTGASGLKAWSRVAHRKPAQKTSVKKIATKGKVSAQKSTAVAKKSPTKGTSKRSAPNKKSSHR